MKVGDLVMHVSNSTLKCGIVTKVDPPYCSVYWAGWYQSCRETIEQLRIINENR